MPNSNSPVLTPLLSGVNHAASWSAPFVTLSPSFHRGFYGKDGTCVLCSSTCRTCEGNETNCQSCKAGFVLYKGECHETCPERHVAVEAVCRQCPDGCYDCLHEETCKGTWRHAKGSVALATHGKRGYAARSWATCLPTLTKTNQFRCLSLRMLRVTHSISITDSASQSKQESLLPTCAHTQSVASSMQGTSDKKTQECSQPFRAQSQRRQQNTQVARNLLSRCCPAKGFF